MPRVGSLWRSSRRTGRFSSINIGDDVLGEEINSEHEASSHAIAVARVALDDYDGGLSNTEYDIRGKELLMVCFLSRCYWGERGKHK